MHRPQVYYNDNNAYTCEWVKNLIQAGYLPQGDVDDRPVQQVQPSDLDGYTQCHFFAGIGGWPLALQLAGWPDDRPVWTGSCPCQPFSVAGKRRGSSDERHLWPEFYRLIEECRPATVLGEQVASKAGREWLAGVFTDLENVGYAVAGADLCAAGTGAPHIRQRLWWVALSNGRHTSDQELQRSRQQRQFEEDGEPSGVADTQNSNGWWPRPETDVWGRSTKVGRPDTYSRIYCWDGKARRIGTGIQPLAHGIPKRVAKLSAIGNAIVVPLATEFIKAVMGVLEIGND